MKRIIFLIFLIMFLSTAKVAWADEYGDTTGDGYGGIEDAYKYSQSIEDAFAGQKKVSDEDFQKALNEVKARQAKGKKKQKALKGKSFNDETSGGYIKETKENVLILRLPIELSNSDGVEIPIGLYKIVGKKSDKNVYLDFYQSATLVARVPATETKSDFNESDINFVKLIPYDNNTVKVIYGSMDFNAYTFIRIKNGRGTQN